MITIAAHGAPNADNHGPAVQVSMRCELSQETCSSVFTAALIRAEQRFWDEDPEPDLIETIVCENELDCLLPAVFQAVDQWLYAGHRLCVTPTRGAPASPGPARASPCSSREKPPPPLLPPREYGDPRTV